MTEDLSLEEAALHLGIPPGVLHNWAWAKTGPKSNGSYWKPRFRIADLDAWAETVHGVKFGRAVEPLIRTGNALLDSKAKRV